MKKVCFKMITVPVPVKLKGVIHKFNQVNIDLSFNHYNAFVCEKFYFKSPRKSIITLSLGG